jgi:hypothetical protein
MHLLTPQLFILFTSWRGNMSAQYAAKKNPGGYLAADEFKKAASLSGLATVQGDDADLIAGQVTIVTFWASWCRGSKQALPQLRAMCDERPGLRLVLLTQEEEVDLRNFLESSEGKKCVAADTTVAIEEGKATMGCVARKLIDSQTARRAVLVGQAFLLVGESISGDRGRRPSLAVLAAHPPALAPCTHAPHAPRGTVRFAGTRLPSTRARSRRATW